MEFTIKYGMEFKDDSVMNSSNSSKFDIAFKAISAKKTSTGTEVDYQFDKFEKKVFQLDKTQGLSFDKGLIDMLEGVAPEKIKGLFIHCYNSTPEDNDYSPIRFELWSGGAKTFLTSDFCIGNMKDFVPSDWRIKNIPVADEKTANLQIIALIEQ